MVGVSTEYYVARQEEREDLFKWAKARICMDFCSDPEKVINHGFKYMPGSDDYSGDRNQICSTTMSALWYKYSDYYEFIETLLAANGEERVAFNCDLGLDLFSCVVFACHNSELSS